MERNGVWKRGRVEGGSGTSAADDVDGILCVKGGGALVIVVGVLVGEENAIEMCAGGGWEGRRRGGGLLLLRAVEGMDDVRVCRKKTCEGDKAMRAASLIFLDAGNGSGEEVAVRQEALGHIWKWKGWLAKEGRRQK